MEMLVRSTSSNCYRGNNKTGDSSLEIKINKKLHSIYIERSSKNYIFTFFYFSIFNLFSYLELRIGIHVNITNCHISWSHNHVLQRIS